jgi:hypothetical protein
MISFLPKTSGLKYYFDFLGVDLEVEEVQITNMTCSGYLTKKGCKFLPLSFNSELCFYKKQELLWH